MGLEVFKFRVTYQRKSQVAAYRGGTSAPVHTLEVEALNNDEAKRIVARGTGRINILAFPPTKRGRVPLQRRDVPIIRNKPPVGYKPTPFLKTEGVDGNAGVANKLRQRQANKAACEPKPHPLLDIPEEISSPVEKALEVLDEELKGEARIGGPREVVANNQRPTELHIVHVDVVPIPPVKEEVQCCPLDDDFDGNCPIHLSPGVPRYPDGAGPVGASGPYAEDMTEAEANDLFDNLLDEERPPDDPKDEGTGGSSLLAWLLGIQILLTVSVSLWCWLTGIYAVAIGSFLCTLPGFVGVMLATTACTLFAMAVDAVSTPSSQR